MGRTSHPAGGNAQPRRPRRLTHFVYILCCADGTLYTGYARDPAARVVAHNAGRGAKYTAARRPVTLLYTKGFRTKGRALAREYAIKQLTRAEKLTVIAEASDRTPAAITP